MRINTEQEIGHENMGIVEELGEGVTLLKKGDRVVMPFNVADGRCRNCEEGRTAFCTGVNPGFAGGAYGRICGYDGVCS
jgi:threonine dehydrogenase-like Zn-dependent dehydrogenase